jgi:proteasome accessory factor C
MPPVPAGQQARRLLVMVPWLIGNSPVGLDELAEAFGISRAQAEKDVLAASMVGVPPYGPGDFVDVWLDGDEVHSSYQPILDRPPRLTPAEGLVVVAAGRALLDVEGSGGGATLASALEKLEAVLGRTKVAVDLQSPPLLGAVREAVAEGRRLHVRYYAAWRDEESERDIDPHVVHQQRGRWYVDAWCHRTESVRRFRIDRIRSLVDTGERFDPVRAPAPSSVYEPPDALMTEVTLDLPASARWVVEAYPCTWTAVGDRLHVTVRVVGEAWLERLLLRVGPEARVVSPASLSELGARVAKRLLAAMGRA